MKKRFPHLRRVFEVVCKPSNTDRHINLFLVRGTLQMERSVNLKFCNYSILSADRSKLLFIYNWCVCDLPFPQNTCFWKSGLKALSSGINFMLQTVCVSQCGWYFTDAKLTPCVKMWNAWWSIYQEIEEGIISTVANRCYTWNGVIEKRLQFSNDSETNTFENVLSDKYS